MKRAGRTKSQAKKTPTSTAHSSAGDRDSDVCLAICHVDALLEKIRTNKLRTFDAHSIEQLKKLSGPDLKSLYGMFHHTILDVKQALAGDEFYLEAYSQYTKPQLKLVLEYLKQLKGLKHDDSVKGRRIRLGHHGPRKKKEKSPEQLVSKVLYLPKDPETGISSVSPTNLIGATEVWIYNVKTRKLGCYYAKDAQGLSVKGTTVLNYDEKRSTTKNLRKPDKQIREFMSGQLPWMRKYWEAIRSVPQEIPPRLSRDTLILRTKQS